MGCVAPAHRSWKLAAEAKSSFSGAFFKMSARLVRRALHASNKAATVKVTPQEDQTPGFDAKSLHSAHSSASRAWISERLF
jgi:hypothetical protein